MKRREFERTTPEAVGLRSEDIEWLLDELESGFTEMHGLMIMRHGKVCAEGWWAPYGPGVRHGLQSLSKTYAATAVGIACTEGLLHLDDKVIDIFEKIEDEKLDGLDFVETEACRGGCFGGSLTVENSYSAKANIKPLIDEAKEKYGERTLNLPGEEDELLRNRPLC